MADQVAPSGDSDKPAESDLVEGRSHGRDETGAPAPDQIDQAEINDEKKADPEKRDPRWPVSNPIAAIPAEKDRAKELNEDYHEKVEDARDASPLVNPPMGGDKAEPEDKK